MTERVVGKVQARVPGLPPTIPDSTDGKKNEPTRPGCAIQLSRLLDPKNDLPEQEELGYRCQELALSAPGTSIEQEESCYGCLKSPGLGLLKIEEECPAMDAAKALETVLHLRKAPNRAYTQRIRHILDNHNVTPRIGGLDDETRRALKGEDIGEEKSLEENQKGDRDGLRGLSPQAWGDVGRGVDPDILTDLGY